MHVQFLSGAPTSPLLLYANRADNASCTMSATTPAAVTSSPAPAPCTTRGLSWYRADVTTSMLAGPDRSPNGESADTWTAPKHKLPVSAI